jgi:hypothetical protein
MPTATHNTFRLMTSMDTTRDAFNFAMHLYAYSITMIIMPIEHF